MMEHQTAVCGTLCTNCTGDPASVKTAKCTQLVISSEMHEWYKSLPTTSHTKDRLPEAAVDDSADDDSA